MFKNESEFEKLISRLNIDDKPSRTHRENLRRQMVSAFNRRRKQDLRTGDWQVLRRTIMKNRTRKFAAVAAIVILVILPLGYGAVKTVKYLTTTFKATFEYPEDNTVYTVLNRVSTSGDNIKSEEDALKAQEEFYKLYKEGKAKEVKPGVWVVTLSNGVKFAYGGDPEVLGFSDAERKELLKKQFDEINELRKAGRFEKIYKPEHDFDVNGVKHRYFIALYTLSNGKVARIGSSEPAKEGDEE